MDHEPKGMRRQPATQGLLEDSAPDSGVWVELGCCDTLHIRHSFVFLGVRHANTPFEDGREAWDHDRASSSQFEFSYTRVTYRLIPFRVDTHEDIERSMSSLIRILGFTDNVIDAHHPSLHISGIWRAAAEQQPSYEASLDLHFFTNHTLLKVTKPARYDELRVKLALFTLGTYFPFPSGAPLCWNGSPLRGSHPGKRCRHIHAPASTGNIERYMMEELKQSQWKIAYHDLGFDRWFLYCVKVLPV